MSYVIESIEYFIVPFKLTTLSPIITLSLLHQHNEQKAFVSMDKSKEYL